MKWRAMAAAAVLWSLTAVAPAFAQTVTLSQAAEAAQKQDLPTLRRALDDPQLVSSLEAIDPDAAIELQLSIAQAFEKAGDKRGAIDAYQKAVASIARAHGGHDDMEMVEPLRRTAALRRDLGDLTGAVTDIDKAFAIATDAKHSSLIEVRGEHAAIRAAFVAANPDVALPGDYQPRGGVPSGYDVVEVFYATHRKPTGATEPVNFYGGERGPLVYGRALVSVPRDRAAGSMPKPSFWRAEFRPDPNRHIILTGVKPIETRDGFFDAVKTRVDSTSRKEVFVFIHGFNTSFQGGAERAAQLAADLSIDGAPILYSWPSKGSVLAYKGDEAEAEVDSQIADLADFLDDVAKRTGATKVNLIAHSMGNRFMIKALNKLAERPVAEQPRFDEVVLAAPDVGVDDFAQRWPQIRAMGKRFTLYASKRDKALLISGQIHNMPRIGDARKIVVTEGLQTVETTAASGGLLGHTDFAGTALDDFRGLIWYSLTPDKRCVLQTDTTGGQTFWVFAGAGACPEAEFREAVSLARTEGSPAAAAQRVQAMISELGSTPSAAADVSLLKNVQRLLLAFPVGVAEAVSR
jgi:esterase/lipase superfamily enzyme